MTNVDLCLLEQVITEVKVKAASTLRCGTSSTVHHVGLYDGALSADVFSH